MVDFCPISLCNGVYKLNSRVLVNRLTGVIGRMINPAQSAFVHGRLIADNVVSSFEAFYSLNIGDVGCDNHLTYH